MGRDSNGILILCSTTSEKLKTVTGRIGDLDLKLDAERDATSNNIKKKQSFNKSQMYKSLTKL